MRFIWAAALIIAIVLSAQPTTASAAGCEFVLGFKALHDLIPGVVGDCSTNEYFNISNGDSLQSTTGPLGGTGTGLLVWRKADNWTAYTDGNRTWVNGPFGLEQRFNVQRFKWEPDALTTSWTQMVPETNAETSVCGALPGTATGPLATACFGIRSYNFTAAHPQAPPPPTPTIQCPPFQTDHVGLGGNIVYRRSIYVPVGYGLYGNVQIYGANATLGFSIQDSNGSVLWGGGTYTGSGLIIFDPTYSDTFQIVVVNPYGSNTKTLILNWRVCPVPSA